MEIFDIISYELMKTALKEADLKVDKVEKRGKKTVITVIRSTQKRKKYIAHQKQAKNKL
jgi:hypothetical protein